MNALPHPFRRPDSAPDTSIYPATPDSDHGRLIHRLAATDVAVLVRGLPGAGKLWVARSIHALAGTSPLVELQACDRSSDDGDSCEAGRVFAAARRAAGGTLLVTDVGRLSSHAQAALAETIERDSLSARVVGCVHENRDEDRELGLRRELIDSFLQVELPPLCERGEELGAIVRLHLTYRAEIARCTVPALSGPLLERLVEAGWPASLGAIDRLARQVVREGDARRAVREALRRGPEKIEIQGPRSLSAPSAQRPQVLPFRREKVFRSSGSDLPRHGPLRVPTPEES